MDRLELMAEAYRRNLLPPDKAVMFEEAVKRGLVRGIDTMLVTHRQSPDAPGAVERLGRGFADVQEGVQQLGIQAAEGLRELSPGQAGLIGPIPALYRKFAEMAGIGEPGQAKAFTKARTDDIARYEQGRGPDAGTDWMRLAGGVAGTAPVALIPGGQATLPMRALVGAGQGAAASGAMFTPQGESKAAQVALGGATGAALPYVAQGVKQAGRAVMDRVAPQVSVRMTPAARQAIERDIEVRLQTQGVNWRQLGAETKDALMAEARRALETGGKLDDVQLARIADIKAIGATPTRAAVTRDPGDWTSVKNLRGVEGVGEPIRRVEQDNARAMVNYLTGLRNQSGGAAKSAYQAGEGATEAILTKEREMQNAVSQLYRVIDKQLGKAVTVAPKQLSAAMDEVSVRMDADPIIGTVNRYLAKVKANETGYLATREAEELRKLIRDVTWDKGASMRQIGNRLIDALDDDVFSGFGRDSPYKLARDAAKAKFAEFEGKAAQGAIAGRTAPEDFVKRYVLDGKVSDLREVRRLLTTGTQEQRQRGAQAWADLRGQVFDHLLLKATGAQTLDDVAGQAFSFARFSRALNAMEPEKLHTLFSPKEIDQLRTLERASKLLTSEVPFSDVNHSKTTAALANLLQKIGNTPVLAQMLSPVMGVIKLGKDWVDDAAKRQQVAEILVGSAVRAGKRAPLPASRLEPALPGVAAAGFYQSSQGADE